MASDALEPNPATPDREPIGTQSTQPWEARWRDWGLDQDGSRATHNLTSIYTEHHDFVWRVCRGLGLDGTSADDAVQEVFIVVCRRIDDFEGHSSLRGWIYGITQNVARRMLSRARRDFARRTAENVDDDRADVTEFVLPRDPGGSRMSDSEVHELADRWMAREQAQRMLGEFLDKLDKAKREVFTLCELYGLTLVEAAETLEINANTASSRLRLARQRWNRWLATIRTSEARVDAHTVRAVITARRNRAPTDADRRRVWLLLLPTLGLPATQASAESKPSEGPETPSIGAPTPTATCGGSIAASTAKAWPWAAASIAVVGLAGVMYGESRPFAPSNEQNAQHQLPSTIEASEKQDEPASASLNGRGNGELGRSRPEMRGPRGVALDHSRERLPEGSKTADDQGRKQAPVRDQPHAGLDQLVQRLHAADEASRRGDHQQALAIVATLGNAASRGPLAPEIEALRASTLCRAGRLDAGRSAFDRFVQRHPNSTLGTRVARACGIR